MNDHENTQFQSWKQNLPEKLREAPLWTYQELGLYLGKPASAVRLDKMRGNCPRAMKLGGLVRFDPRDVFEWVQILREAA